MKPDGVRIDLEVRDSVPYLPDGPEDLAKRQARPKPDEETAYPAEVVSDAEPEVISEDEAADASEGEAIDDGPVSPQHLLTHHP